MSKRRDSAQLERDRRRIAEMYLRGALQVDIAEELHIDQSTVSRDLKALQDEWRASALIDINEAKARELAKIDALEREYWDAWQESKHDAETWTSETKEGHQPYTKESKTAKGQVGDASFLAGVMSCITKRCQILGLDAPKKLEHTGADGGPVQVNDEGHNRALLSLADALGAIVSDAGAESKGDMDATE